MSLLKKIISFILLPFTLLYGIITFIRNKLYDYKLLESISYDNLYVISVGNITVGGTGKTPHVEYLIRLLSAGYKTAILSRGYKRKTKGFILADMQSTAADIGDEPYQMKQKFPDITIAVDANRIEGIQKLRSAIPDLEIILLDDAFQYRKINPDCSVLLMDYNRPLYKDHVFPSGRMREWAISKERADILIVSKVPGNISGYEQEEIKSRYGSQCLYFSTISYGNILSYKFPGKTTDITTLSGYNILLITGIATPQPFKDYVQKYVSGICHISYPDHHSFTDADIQEMNKQWGEIQEPKLMITTEKDIARLSLLKMPDVFISFLHFIPIEVKFIENESRQFNQEILRNINNKLIHK